MIVKAVLRFIVLVWAAGIPCVVAAAEPDWNPLVELAKRHGLPMPAAGSQIALIHGESWRPVGNRSHPHDPASYEPGWVIKKGADGSVAALRGTKIVHLTLREDREPMAREFVATRMAPKLGSYVAEFDRSESLIAAIQCAAIGDMAHARELWNLHDSDNPIRRYGLSKDELRMLATPEGLLAFELISMWKLRLEDPDHEREQIETAMRGLIETFPVLAGRGNEELLADLRLTNRAPAAEPGSVEALLVEMGLREPVPVTDVLNEDWDRPAGRIVRRGFEAIPELIRLRSDRRLTFWRGYSMSGDDEGPKRMGDLAESLLWTLLPDTAKPSGDHKYTEAWEKIRGRNEADYFTSVAFTREKKVIRRVNDGPLAVLADKFSARLPEIIGEFLVGAGPDVPSDYLARAVIRSDLPKKSEFLAERAMQGSVLHRWSFTQALVDSDPAAAKATALDLVRNLPRDVSGAYWTSAAGGASYVVLGIDDDAVWQAFFGKAREAKVGLILEWMKPFDSCYVGRVQERRLAFLAGFLDDERVRDEKKDAKKYDGPCAAFTFPVIAVRDFAAMQIASILEIDPLDSPDATWAEVRWSALRDKVRKRLVAEGIQAMKGE